MTSKLITLSSAELFADIWIHANHLGATRELVHGVRTQVFVAEARKLNTLKGLAFEDYKKLRGSGAFKAETINLDDLFQMQKLTMKTPVYQRALADYVDSKTKNGDEESILDETMGVIDRMLEDRLRHTLGSDDEPKHEYVKSGLLTPKAVSGMYTVSLIAHRGFNVSAQDVQAMNTVINRRVSKDSAFKHILNSQLDLNEQKYLIKYSDVEDLLADPEEQSLHLGHLIDLGQQILSDGTKNVFPDGLEPLAEKTISGVHKLSEMMVVLDKPEEESAISDIRNKGLPSYENMPENEQEKPVYFEPGLGFV